MKTESVQSCHPCQSVIQTLYDIAMARGGELKVKKRWARETFFIELPMI